MFKCKIEQFRQFFNRIGKIQENQKTVLLRLFIKGHKLSVFCMLKCR